MKTKHIFFLIVFCASFWRIVNYDNRWTLGSDQARDVIIANYSLTHHTFPLIGPPSSLGSFSFGPIYYWLIMLFELIPLVNAPWMGFTAFSIATVAIFYFVGFYLEGKSLAVILGLLSAFASGPIFHSVDLLNPMLIPFFTTLSFFCLILMEQRNKPILSFLLTFSIGLAISFHFQAIGLLSILVLSFFLSKSTKNSFLMVLGLALPFLPMAFFNFFHGNILMQKLLSSPNSQIMLSKKYFIRDPLVTWPNLWGEVLTFYPKLGYIFLPAVVIGLIYFSKKLRLRPTMIIISSLIVQAFFLALYQGDRGSVYLLVFHPYVIFLTGLVIWFVWNKSHIIGIATLSTLLLVSTYSDINIAKGFTQKPFIYSHKQKIDGLIEGKNNSVSIYEVGNNETLSLPLYYLYLKEGRISSNGFKIGACFISCPSNPVPFLAQGNYFLYNLNELTSQRIRQAGFDPITQDKIYQKLYDYYQ